MKRSIRKWWLESNLIIRGAEGEDDKPGTGDEGSDDDSGGGDESKGGAEGGADEDDDSDDEKETFTKEDVEGLRKALREERKARRVAERANKAKAKDDSDAKEKTEADDAAKRLKTAEERTAKLAEGYRTARVDSVIARFAQKANVVNPDDMVALLKSRGYVDIEVDQDDDDPSSVEVDEDDVKDAIKSALKTRKHWIKSDDGEDDKEQLSGSKMRPGGQRKSSLEDQALKDQYPALRMRR